MDKTLFEDLVQSLQEAKAIARGEAEPSRRFVVKRMDVKAIREKTGLWVNLHKRHQSPIGFCANP